MFTILIEHLLNSMEEIELQAQFSNLPRTLAKVAMRICFPTGQSFVSACDQKGIPSVPMNRVYKFSQKSISSTPIFG
jgi:hypothetical protein